MIHYQMCPLCSSLQSPQLVLGSFTALASHHQPARAETLPVQTSANILRISCLALGWSVGEGAWGASVLQSINISLPCVIYKSQCDIAISLQNTYCLCKSTPSCVHFYLIYSKRSCILACPSSKCRHTNHY